MYFKRIDMHGFKSFAEPVSVEFHEGITCIVGPNGSGKSNISDAIRWVLGEQSPKMLRGGKMEEVIFAGTASRKSRGMAEVTLVIDNSTGFLAIDYAEVAITRRMYRSGESEYSINNHQCRLKDIRELIMDTGIGVDGYSLIGQGKIAEIVSNKPESRREIFEEAAGIVKYRSKKAESERKLESTAVNLERVNDIVTEIESRLDGLASDSEKAKEYLLLRETYQELEINITLKNIENLELKNEYITDELAELENELNQNKAQKVEIDQQLTESQIKNEELTKLSNEVRDKLLVSVEGIGHLANQSQLFQEKLETNNKEHQRLGEEVAAIDLKLEKEQENAILLESQKSEMNQEIVQLEAELAGKLEAYRLLSEAMAAETGEVDERKSKVYELHSAVNSKKVEINSLENLQHTLLKRKEQVSAEGATSDEQSDQLAEEFRGVEEEILALKRKLEEAAKEQRELSEQHQRNAGEERSLSLQVDKLKLSAGEASARQKMLQEMEQAYEGYHHGVKFVMKSQLSGIEGVVAELIEVPKGYETAIETALGGALQNIVCDHDHSAKTAIEALKKNKAGRLTFLPLSSIKAPNLRHDEGLKRAVGFCGFGVDCVHFDPKYRKVMEYLLGRVVVVEGLEQAITLSKSSAAAGLRFVTLEGEIINAGGAITGGAYRNNSANLLERKTQTKELEERVGQLQQQMQEKETKLQEYKTKIAAQEKRREEIMLTSREAERELMAKEHQSNLLSRRLTDLAESEEKRQKELTNLGQEMNSSDEMILLLRQHMTESEAEIQRIEQLADAGLSQLEEKRIRLAAMNEEITAARVSAGASENQKANVNQNLTRIAGYLQELNKEKESKHLRLAALEKERTDIHHEMERVTQERADMDEARQGQDCYLNEIVREQGEAAARQTALTEKKTRLDELLTSHQGKKYEHDIKKAKLETQLDSYKDKLWEEFEISYLQAIEFKKQEFSLGPAVKQSREIKNRIKSLGEVNVGAIKEYETVNERYEFLSEQRQDILQAMNGLKQIIDEMDRTIKRNFQETFQQILMNFEQAFQELFGGGTAQLRLEDESRPLDCGIEIVAQPPGKKLQNINLMSGGEKTMTAIALMFAVLKTKPTPFCILDEVEAALDDANIKRFGQYLAKFGETQFALVTHQKVTMEYADVLYGVTMPEQGVSRILSLKLGAVTEGLSVDQGESTLFLDA